MIPINPEAIGDPNQTPVVYIGEENGKALGIRDSSPPSPAQHLTGQVDLEEVRKRYADFHRAIIADSAMRDAWPAIQSADDVPALLADLDAARTALAEAQRERDEERRKVEALLLGDKALQPRIWLREEVQRLKAELTDLSNLLDQTMAARDQYKRERNAAYDEDRLMRPVVEAARAMAARWRDSTMASGNGLLAAVDTYETQTGGTDG